MSKKNKRNVLFFKGKSMPELFGRMDKWQKKNNKRFLSVSVQKDGEIFYCIALTNPSEVVITDVYGLTASVSTDGLCVDVGRKF